MKYRKITAIINDSSLEAVELALKEQKAIQVTMTKVTGYGDYKNFYNSEWLSMQARVEVFVLAEHAEQVVQCIMRIAHAGSDTDGMIAVIPVETIYHVKDYVPSSNP
ncbi:MAG: P-II family nitrogen regulator [Rhodanobacter sp.]|nr:MAG: P-II family nitrogen regulator [Rhodanobacter sp.]TAL91448.1 MAG: P-II family nitrogen regulator [Rhodanobacter sp.]TAM42151.1 MAG: P-II family nitrogen regulator [Rhodanobacter sp.]TAN26752.1 MAG: P-II family nitrogen regulator [Rhodanobacter sp.]